MANEEKEVLETETEEVEEPTEPTEDEEDKTDWKALAMKNAGIAKRNATRLEKLKKAAEAKVEAPAEKSVPKDKSKEFDYAEKAFLKSSGIASGEYELVKEVMQATGKSIDDVLESKYFQSELKERRDAQATKDAIPPGSKRAALSARDDVDYWLAKGTLPTVDQPELRRKVLNARIKQEESKSQFSSKSIV